MLDELARDLKRRIGKGFTKRYLEMFRRFYLHYPIAKSLISQFGLCLPAPSSVKFQPLDWQDDEYFAQRKVFEVDQPDGNASGQWAASGWESFAAGVCGKW